uniref:Uncharacterized protein n=1 Tax=Ficus carica TaxID=3494 RepID=A0AA88E8Q1_FICCA|nr:hypothetical protein TIFTF001_036794 [Ficus carica]
MGIRGRGMLLRSLGLSPAVTELRNCVAGEGERARRHRLLEGEPVTGSSGGLHRVRRLGIGSSPSLSLGIRPFAVSWWKVPAPETAMASTAQRVHFGKWENGKHEAKNKKVVEFLWSSSIANKVKLFIWRSYHNVISTLGYFYTRDHSGFVTKKIAGCSDTVTAECLAVREGLLFAVESRLLV